jgi:hypothetical protein
MLADKGQKVNIKRIIKEEIMNVLEVSMTREFTKAVEALQKVQLEQQKLQKAFVAEKDSKKKEKFKQALIKMHKVVQKAEMNFNDAVRSEPIDLGESELNESMIGIQTKANFKPNQLKGALEKAGIKGFQMNRLSVTLTALKLDKKYYKAALKIIDALRLKVMMAKESINEMDINDPILIAVRARKTMIAKAKAAPKVKKISTKQYYKLMDKEIDLIQRMKDAAKEYEQLDSDMNQEAGQKGADWSDDDANRYGRDLDKLQTKIEKLAKQKLAVKKQIMNYRIN